MRHKLLHSWETVIVVITISLFTLANSLEIVIEWLKNKPGFVFNAIAHSYPDYFLYLSHVAQGAAGRLVFTSHQFTNEPLPKTSIYWLYSIIGYVGGRVGLSPPLSYNVSLILLAAAVLILWYAFCRKLYPANRLYRLTTFLVVISASPFIDIGALIKHGAVEFPQYLWFSPMPAFNRLGGVPHQIFQTIVLLLVLFGLSKAKNIRSLLLLAILSFVATYAQPIQMALLLIAAGVSALVTDRKRLIPVIAAGLASIPAAIAVNYEFTTPIYAVTKNWELLQYSPTGLVWWVSVIGPIVLLIPFGIWPFIKKANTFRLTFFLYCLLCFAIYNSPIPKLIGVVPQRFLHPASYALLPVLAVSGLFAIQKDLAHLVKYVSLGRLLQRCFLFAIALVYIIFTVPADIAQIGMKIHDPNLLQVSQMNHTPVALVRALQRIQSIANDSTHPVVLAEKNLGVDLLIPLYTGHITFIGHPIHTLYPNVKEGLRQKFFSGGMTNDEMRRFFVDHRIGYIVTDKSLTNPMLTRIYTNDTVSIYTVTP